MINCRFNKQYIRENGLDFVERQLIEGKMSHGRLKKYLLNLLKLT